MDKAVCFENGAYNLNFGVLTSDFRFLLLVEMRGQRSIRTSELWAYSFEWRVVVLAVWRIWGINITLE